LPVAREDLKFFRDRRAWRTWLEKNHATHAGFWMVYYKNHTGKKGIDYDAAVEEALCFGWIDSLIHRVDDARYARKFTPRTNAAHWSAINLERVKRMKAAGLMKPAGLARLGKGVKAYVPLMQRELDIPKELQRALARNVRARTNFERLAPGYRRHYIGWIATAKKDETRARRVRQAISLLAANRKLGLK
jgi:uncharacterized protein YdeI (YjbR/CyaY-like superfamily)